MGSINNSSWLCRAGLMVGVFAMAACGGGGGSGTSASSGSTATEVTAAQSLTALPSLDASDYDLTVDAAASESAPLNLKGLSKARFSETGDFSMAGCEAERHKNELIRITKEMEGTQCMVKKGNEIGVIKTGENKYAYYDFTPEVPEGGGQHEQGGKTGSSSSGGGTSTGGGKMMEDSQEDMPEMKARIGLFCEDDNGNKVELGSDGSCSKHLKFKMDMCEDGAQVMQMRYTVDGALYSGVVVHEFDPSKHGGDQKELKNAAANKKERGKITLEVNTTETGAYDFSTALIRGSMEGNFGQGAMSLQADAATVTNTVQGNFASKFEAPNGNSVNNSGTMAARWSGTNGCGMFEGTGEFPAMSCPYEDWVPTAFKGSPCCILPPKGPGETEQYSAPNASGNCAFSHADTEPYSIILEEGIATNWPVAASNNYCTEVEALEDLKVEEIAFADEWDCTGTFEKPDFSAMANSTTDPFEECFDKQNEGREGGDHELCMQQMGSEKRDEHREDQAGKQGGGGKDSGGIPNNLVSMKLSSSSGCTANPMPEAVNAFIQDNNFGMDADVAGDGEHTQPIGGGELSNGALVTGRSGFDPNQGDHEDGHHSCTGTVSKTGITVTGCEDGCKFTYTAQ